MITIGITALQGLEHLGTVQQGKVFNEALGIYETQKGDNSMLLLLAGVVAIIAIFVFLLNSFMIYTPSIDIEYFHFSR